MVTHAALIGANLLTLVVLLVNVRLQWQINATQQEHNKTVLDIHRVLHGRMLKLERRLPVEEEEGKT